MIRWTLPVAMPLVLLAACSSSSQPKATVKSQPVVPSVSPTAAPAEDAAIAACAARKAVAGEIILRTIYGTGQPAQAQLLGDQWNWNYTSGECQTGTDFLIAGAPTGPGACTQAALAQDNPAYNLDAVPAAPLQKSHSRLTWLLTRAHRSTGAHPPRVQVFVSRFAPVERAPG